MNPAMRPLLSQLWLAGSFQCHPCIGAVHEQAESSLWEGYGLITPIKMEGCCLGRRCCSLPSPSSTFPPASAAPTHLITPPFDKLDQSFDLNLKEGNLINNN